MPQKKETRKMPLPGRAPSRKQRIDSEAAGP